MYVVSGLCKGLLGLPPVFTGLAVGCGLEPLTSCNAIWRLHVDPRLSVQVTILPRPRQSARVQVSCCTPCCTAAIRTEGTTRGPRYSPDQR
jgi:hypothetical protein